MTESEHTGTTEDSDARRRRPPLVTRAQAIQVSYDLIRDEGPAGLSMRKLATALHVSLPTVYTAISSKDTLIGELQERLISEIADAVTPALSTRGDAVERVSAMVDTVLIWCRRNPRLAEFFMHETIDPAVALAAVRATNDPVRTVVAMELANAVGPSLSSVDPLVSVAYTMAQLQATVSLAFQAALNPDDGQWGAICTTNVIAGLRHLFAD